MAKDLNRSIKIYIDNAEAMKSASALAGKIADVEKALQKLDSENKKGSAEYTKLEKKLGDYRASMTRYEEKIKDTERVLRNLSGATKGELLQVQKRLQSELKNLTRGTKEYEAAVESLKAVKLELIAVQKEESLEVGKSGTAWSRMANGFNKYFGIVTSLIAGITGLSFAFRKLAEDVAQMDDVYADVMKTTGMTRDQVLDLNEEFKKMDTRTARDRLNLLARDAGKLGLEGKKNILDFVEAGNQIDVSLGEDLGEGAIKAIGKMTDVYALSTKELEKLDLKGKMLAIGSAINELGASSTAAESYMVNFTQRLGGVASQAGISIQDILGYASALDQSGQAVEMSATALQKFIMKLMGDPAKFAKMAGIEVDKFNKLLKEDTNEAIKQVLTALSEKGGFQQLIPIFKDMGLDGARAVGVLSALATNIDKVNEAQEISNKAFAEGTSITDEYNIKNDNLQAQLEKSRKAFKDAALELGEKLSPALLKSTKATTYIIKSLPSLFNWIDKNKTIIIALTSAIAAYVVGVKLATAAQTKWTIADQIHYRWLQLKGALLATLRTGYYTLAAVMHLVTGNTVKATAAWKMLSDSMKANVIGLTLAGITALGVAIYNLATRTTKAEEAINSFNAEAMKQQKELNNIFAAYKKANEGTAEKDRLLKIIKEKYGAYIKNLIDEKGRITDIDEAQKLANKSLRESIALKMRDAAMSSIQEESMKELADQLGSIRDAIAIQKGDALANEMIKQVGDFFADERIPANIAAIQARKYLEDNGVKIGENSKFFSDNIRKNLIDVKNIVEKERNERIDLMNKFTGIISATDKLVNESDSNIDISNNSNNKTNTTDYSDTPDEKELNKQLKQQKTAQSRLLEELETVHLTRMSDIRQRFIEGDIKSNAEYEQERFSEQQAYYLKREILLQKFIDTTNDINLKSNLQKELAELQNKRLNQEIKFRAQLEEIILNANPEAKEKKEYEERLRAAGIQEKTVAAQKIAIAAETDEKRKKQLQVQLQALESLEQVHNDNLFRIRESSERRRRKQFDDSYKKTKTDYEKQFTELRGLIDIQEQLGFLAGTKLFDKEESLLKMRLKANQKELDAAKIAGINYDHLLQERADLETDMTKLYVSEYQRRYKLFSEFSVNIGEALGNALMGNEDMVKSSMINIINIGLDLLKAQVQMAIVGATAQALAQPDSVLTFGAAGLARAAVLTALIEGVFAAAKSVISGIISGSSSKSSSSSSDSGGGNFSGSISVGQRAEGKYDVVGADDGRLYRNVPFIGTPHTGVVNRTSLIAENGGELIVSSPDMKALQRHVNYPMVVRALQDIKSGTVPQRADGKYDTVKSPIVVPDNTPSVVDVEILRLLQKLNKGDIKAKTYFGMSELDAEQKNYNREQNRFTKKS